MNTERDPDMELDCTAVLADVWLMLDGECDDRTRERLQHHMDNCSPCIEAYGIEEKVKSLLHRKCGGDKAPDSLRERLAAELHRSGSCTAEDISADPGRA